MVLFRFLISPLFDNHSRHMHAQLPTATRADVGVFFCISVILFVRFFYTACA